ncbi:MAG: hypothetical protein NZ603_01585, partial [Acidimicrobiales bacterium]|nr:hypothetical protein [Acidimicrobiales bacterium]
MEGGSGDDILTDLSGPDVIEGGDGNDAISSGNEEDVIFGDDGNDFIVNPSEFGEIFAGQGDDFIYDGIFIGHIRGGAGDDWMENEGGGEDLWQADNGAAPEAGEPATKGNDVMVIHGGNTDADMENGDDIVVDGPGIDRVEGQLGFDWVSFANDTDGVNVDLDLTIFIKPVLPVSNASIGNRYDRVEGISGSPLGDILNGTNNVAVNLSGNELVAENRALIDGLDGLVTDLMLTPIADDPVTGETGRIGWTGGDIILGGGGSDLLQGEGGDDILDGDSALDVGLAVVGDAEIHASMRDVQARVFDGTLPIADISISRAINNAGSAGDVDSAVYSGALDDYVIEGVAETGAPADVDGDGYVRVTDQDTGLLGEGSDLLRNIERILFSDVTVAVGAAGAAASANSLATGQPGIAGIAALGQTLTATAGTVADADGFDAAGISWTWESELEPGESGFTPIVRLVGTAGNTDPFEVTGQNLLVTAAEAGLNVRVVGTFQDGAGVFEVVRSAAVAIACDVACLAALPAGAAPAVANFNGTAAQLQTVVVENPSRVGLPRLDITITGVPLANFPGNNFATPVVATDEVPVGNILLTFANAAGETGVFSPEIIAVTNLAGNVNQDNVDISFS